MNTHTKKIFFNDGHHYCPYKIVILTLYTRICENTLIKQTNNKPVPQTGPPRITFKKRQFFIGEKLIANCTTSKAQPAPHITWLINGKKVNFILLFIYMYIRI